MRPWVETRFIQAIQVALDFRDIVIRGVLGRQRRQLRLDQQTRVAELQQAYVAELEQHRQRLGDNARRWGRDIRAMPWNTRQQSLLREYLQRLTQHIAA